MTPLREIPAYREIPLERWISAGRALAKRGMRLERLPFSQLYTPQYWDGFMIIIGDGNNVVQGPWAMTLDEVEAFVARVPEGA